MAQGKWTFEYPPWVTNVREDGLPLVGQAFYASEPLAGSSSDGIHPAPYVFVIDPPLHLTRDRRYYFAIKEITGFAVINILSDTSDTYTAGRAVIVSPCIDCQGLGCGISLPYNPRWDLIFDLAFCDAATAIRPSTWGQCKVRYR